LQTLNNSIKQILYDLPPNGRCLGCGKKLKIVGNNKTLYKGIPTWVHHDILKVEVRCQDCNIIYIDKKIA